MRKPGGAFLVLMVGPFVALLAAEFLYRVVGVTGTALFGGALAAEWAAGLMLIWTSGCLRACAWTTCAAVLTGGVFWLWASSAAGGL